MMTERDDLPQPLDHRAVFRAVDADLTAVEIAPDNELAGFYRVNVTPNGQQVGQPVRVARWGLSACLNVLGVGPIARWHAEPFDLMPPSDAEYANTPAILAHLERRGLMPCYG